MTFEDGLIKTCLLPFFSALEMATRASLKTFIRTIYKQQEKMLCNVMFAYSKDLDTQIRVISFIGKYGFFHFSF